jgi:hypothetical protein
LGNTKQRRKRNRLVVALMLPELVFAWLVGWSLYWIGHQRENRSRAKSTSEKDNVTVLPALCLEETQEAMI